MKVKKRNESTAETPRGRRGYRVKLRDRAVRTTCNLLLRCFASKDYRRFVAVVYTLGMDRFYEEIERELNGTDEPVQ